MLNVWMNVNAYIQCRHCHYKKIYCCFNSSICIERVLAVQKAISLVQKDHIFNAMLI